MVFSVTLLNPPLLICFSFVFKEKEEEGRGTTGGGEREEKNLALRWACHSETPFNFPQQLVPSLLGVKRLPNTHELKDSHPLFLPVSVASIAPVPML